MSKKKRKLSSKINTHNESIVKESKLSSYTPSIPLANFSFISVYPWLKSVKTREFSNMLKDESEFAKKIYECVSKIIPTVYNECDTIFNPSKSNSFKHCHIVGNSSIEKVKMVCESIYGEKLSRLTDGEDDKDVKWYQLGVSQGTRIFGIYDYNEKSFYPLFCDWNHDICGNDPKNNSKDTRKYKFDPYSEYNK